MGDPFPLRGTRPHNGVQFLLPLTDGRRNRLALFRVNPLILLELIFVQQMVHELLISGHFEPHGLFIIGFQLFKLPVDLSGLCVLCGEGGDELQGFLNIKHRFHVSVDTVTNCVCQQRLADVVGSAGGFVHPIGGTGVVKIFFPACRNGLADHVLLAISAEQKSRKGIDRLFLYGDSGVPAQQAAYGTKIHLADNRLMGAGNPDPLVLWLLHQLLDFIVWPPGLSLNHHTDIEGILQDAPNCYRRPLGLRIAFEAGDILHSQGTLVF